MNNNRLARIAKKVRIGGFDHVNAVDIGANSPLVVQTMWKDKLCLNLTNESEVLTGISRRIKGLGLMGCGLLRFAVPDLSAAELIGRLAEMVNMPLVADIHFDYKLALRCLDFPIAKIRINPGNVGDKGKVEKILNKAHARSRPIRIGVNAGSLPLELRRKVDEGSLDNAEALVLAAEKELTVFNELGFNETIVSIKASSVADTIKANRIFAERSDIPLHVGVTEAGPLVAGVVRNSAALLALLTEGIGDTIRVSLSDSMEKEIIAGREICNAAADLLDAGSAGDNGKTAVKTMVGRLRQNGVTIISCPKCGRSSFDTHGFTEVWQSRLYALKKNISVAVMGCEVNGPQEASHADLGITGSGGKVLIFRRGKIVRTINAAEADSAFQEELDKL